MLTKLFDKPQLLVYLIIQFNNYKNGIYNKMYAIAILRDGPQYRTLIAQGNANYSKAKLNLTNTACIVDMTVFFLTGPKGGETKF